MIINLAQLKDPKRNDPPEEEIRKAEEFYLTRLIHHGYLNREEKSFRALARYFALTWCGIKHDRIPEENPNIYSGPAKGLLIFGPCGSGKTLAISIFSGLFGIEFICADELNQIYARYGEDGFWNHVEQFDHKDLIIDDLGAEREIKSFGNAPVMVEFIYRRERMFKRYGVLTHGTTNLTNREALAEKYGNPALSRIFGMMKPIAIKAGDARIDGI